MIAKRNLFNIITIIIIFNILYNTYETIMASIVEIRNKIIKKIQNII